MADQSDLFENTSSICTDDSTDCQDPGKVPVVTLPTEYVDNSGGEAVAVSTVAIVVGTLVALAVLAVAGYTCYRKHRVRDRGLHQGEEIY